MGVAPSSREGWGRGLVCVSGLGGAAEEWAAVGRGLSRHGEVLAMELTLSPQGGNHSLGGPFQASLAALARFGLRPAAFHAIAARVSCPVLVVHGSDDHYVPPAFALAAAARHPGWQIDLIPGAGHFPHRDDGACWLASVDPFLQQLVSS